MMQRNKISFKGQKIFVGIDVHAKNWEVAIAPEVGIDQPWGFLRQAPGACGINSNLPEKFGSMNKKAYLCA